MKNVRLLFHYLKIINNWLNVFCDFFINWSMLFEIFYIFFWCWGSFCGSWRVMLLFLFVRYFWWMFIWIVFEEVSSYGFEFVVIDFGGWWRMMWLFYVRREDNVVKRLILLYLFCCCCCGFIVEEIFEFWIVGVYGKSCCGIVVGSFWWFIVLVNWKLILFIRVLL